MKRFEEIASWLMVFSSGATRTLAEKPANSVLQSCVCPSTGPSNIEEVIKKMVPAAGGNPIDIRLRVATTAVLNTFAAHSGASTDPIAVKLKELRNLICAAAAEGANTSAGGVDVTFSGDDCPHLKVVQSTTKTIGSNRKYAIELTSTADGPPAQPPLWTTAFVTRMTINGKAVKLPVGNKNSRELLAHANSQLHRAKSATFRMYKPADTPKALTDTFSPVDPQASIAAHEELRKMFQNARPLQPSANPANFVSAMVVAVLGEPDTDTDMPKIQTAMDKINKAADSDIFTDVVRAIVEFLEVRGASIGSTTAADDHVDGSRRPRAAPSSTVKPERVAVFPIQLQEGQLLTLFNAIGEGDDKPLARAMCSGDKGTGRRVDGVLARTLIGDHVPPHAWLSRVAIQEAKVNMTRSSSSDATHSPRPSAGADAATTTGGDSAGIVDQTHFSDFASAFYQCLARVGQGIYDLLNVKEYDDTADGMDQFLEDLRCILPTAMVISDSNSFGVVFFSLNDDPHNRDALPIDVVGTSLSGLSPKVTAKDVTQRHVMAVEAALSGSLPILALLVCEQRNGINITPEDVQALDFRSASNDADHSAGDTVDTSPDGPSRDGDANNGAGEGNPSTGGAGAAPVHPAPGDSNTFSLSIFDDLSGNGTVFRCRIKAVPSVRPRWCAVGVDVILKQKMTPTELACWRSVQGCDGVPRLFVLCKGKRLAAITPDGVNNSTLHDVFGDGRSWRLRDQARPEWAQQFVRRLHEIIQDVHRRGVVHADVHPGNVVVVQRGWDDVPLLIDFGIATHFGDGDGDSLTSLTRIAMTLSPRGSDLLAKGHRTWSPTPVDDLQSIALLGEWLIGNLPNGIATTSTEKHMLLKHAQSRWGIDVAAAAVAPQQGNSLVWKHRRAPLGDISVNAQQVDM